jgi:demethylspheroidene O-methyltransferase
MALRDGLLAVRDRLLTSPRFHRWATASPLLRPVARRRARALFDLVAGFVYSQVLAAGVQLGLFDRLAARPATLPVLARDLGLPEDRAARLLDAAVALRLADRRGGGRYGIGPLGAALVAQPGIAAMIEHHAMLYEDLRDPAALLRGTAPPGQLAAFWAYRDPAADAGPYTALMAASQPMIAAEVLAACRLRRFRCLLDLGGGDGSFAIAAAARAPRLQVIVFDRPTVATQASSRFAAAGLAARARAIGGDFLADPLPTGADIVSLVRVIHDHDDAAARAILAAAHRALPPGGTLLLAEPMGGTQATAAMADAYFGLYLMAMHSGRPRTPAALAALLRETGFADPLLRPTRLPLLVQVMVARRL